MVGVIVLAVLIGLWGLAAIGALIVYVVRDRPANDAKVRPQSRRLGNAPRVHEWHGFPTA